MNRIAGLSWTPEQCTTLSEEK